MNDTEVVAEVEVTEGAPPYPADRGGAGGAAGADSRRDSGQARGVAGGGAGLVERVRRQLLEQTRAERVPAGAPARSGVDIGAMSPPEKIAYALGREAR